MSSPSLARHSLSPLRGPNSFFDLPSYQNSPYSTPYRMSDSTPIGLIDLTADSSPYNLTGFPSVMAELGSDSATEPSTKRRRFNHDTFSGRLPSLIRTSSQHIDEVDLTAVDDDVGLKQLQEEQHLRHDQNIQKQREQQEAEAIRSMHEQSRKPLRVNELQCVVCMENMTNITATHCGHLFCHTCIMEALIAGENQGIEPGKIPSRCPVCRKKVLRSRPGQVIPLELKLLTKSTTAKGKGKEVDRSM